MKLVMKVELVMEMVLVMNGGVSDELMMATLHVKMIELMDITIGEGYSSSDGEFSYREGEGFRGDGTSFVDEVDNDCGGDNLDGVEKLLMKDESISEEMLEPLYPGTAVTICATYCAIMTLQLACTAEKVLPKFFF